MKIYTTGNFLTVDKEDGSTIQYLPNQYTDFDSLGSGNYYIVNSLRPTEKYEFNFSDLKDESGTLVGSESEVITYLTSIVNFKTLTGGSVGTGWAQYGDSQYTVGSPLVISQGITETIDIDGLGSTVKSQLPNGVSDLYDVATSKIIPVKSGDGYSFSLGFQAASTSNNGDATISVNIGGAFGQIFKRVFRMPRGTGIYHDIFFTTQYYTLGTFLANGGTIEIESGNGTTSIHSVTLQIHRTYASI